MFKKFLAIFLVVVVFVSSLSAVIVSAATAEEKVTLSISVVTNKTTNDLLTTLNANYNGIKHYTTLDDALENVESDGTKGIMVLADNYPNTTTAITDTQATTINELGIRLYVEYPAVNETLGITGYSGTGRMGFNRAVVMDADSMNMPLYSILYVHGAQYVAKTDTTNSWLVNATVAGYDTVEFYDETTGELTDCTPYSMLEVNDEGNVLIASTKLSQFITARYAPYERWQKLWLSVLSWVSQSDVTSIEWTPAVNPNYGPTEELADNAYSEAVRLNTQWYINNMIDTTDGIGIYQCYLSGANFNAYGEQAKQTGFRADCNGESIGAIALAGVLLDNQEYKDLAYNTMDWMLNEALMANGDRADPESAQYGLLSWYSQEEYQGSYYGDDNAKAILGLILGASALETNEFDQRILEAILANFRTSGTNGFRGTYISGTDLDAKGWEYYYNRTTTNYRPHFEALLWACYLWAYDKTGYEPLLERTKTGISMMMDAYDATMIKDDDSGSGEWMWTNGMQQERAKMIWPLAWLVRIEPTDEHIEWLDTIITDMMDYQDAETGALRDAFGDTGEGKGEYGPFTSNSAYGTHESPVIQENGDPCTDSLYTSSFAMVTLNEAYAAMASIDATKAVEYQQYAKSISDYHVRIQQVSDTNSKYNGVWFRGFDYKKWETYGSDGDAGWGIWCTETGWSQAQISSALSLQTLGTNIWDYSKSTTINTYFPDTAKLMLNYDVSNIEPTITIPDDLTLRSGYSEDVLVDGVYATAASSWNNSAYWCGAEGQDMTFFIDYGYSKTFDTVTVGYDNYMSIGSCGPASITVYSSADGKNYTQVGYYDTGIDPQITYDNWYNNGAKDGTQAVERVSVSMEQSVTTRYLKVVVKNPGTYNATHAGLTGAKTWMFLDEIEISTNISLENLKELIDKADSYSDLSGYQPATVLEFAEAYKNAVEFYNSGSANNTKLHEAYTALDNAINGLKTATSYSVVSTTNWTNWSSNNFTGFTNENYADYPGRGKVLTDLTALTEQNIEFVVDMQDTVSIMAIGYSAQSLPSSGIYLQDAEFFVSDSLDGPWTSVGTVAAAAHQGEPTVAEYQTLTDVANGGNGRYVKVVFSRDDTHELTVNGTLKRSEWCYVNEILINEFRPINVETQNATVELTASKGDNVAEIGVIYGQDVTVNIIPDENAVITAVTVNDSTVEVTNNSFVIENVTSEQNIMVGYAVFDPEDMPRIEGIKDLFVASADIANFDPRVDIAAYDKDGNDITSSVTYDISNLSSTAGTYTVTYKVTASNGATTTANTNVHVVASLGDKHIAAVTPSATATDSYRKQAKDAQLLVDSAYAPSNAIHSDSRYLAWKNTDNIEVVVAIDGTTAVSEVGYSLAAAPQYGFLPSDVDFYVTDKIGIGAATVWTYVGTVEALEHPYENLSTYDYIKRTIPIEDMTSGYVKAVIRFDDDQDILDKYSGTPGKGVPEWTFVDEIIIGNDNDLKFEGASLTISDNIITNYKVEKARVADYSGLYVKFLYNGKEYTVDKYTEDGDYYVFKFYDVAPHLMSNGIYATLYGTKDGVVYESFESVYSIKRYCHTILENTTDDQTELRTLLVDLLNYGAASQVYKAQADSTYTYKDKEVINKDLTTTQQSWGTSDTPTVSTDAQDLKYATVDNPSVKWKSGNLYLSNAVILLFTIETTDVESITVKATCNGRTWAVNPDNIIATETENRYYVYVTGIKAYEMRDTVYLTVYNGDTAVSNTISYSIEAYVASKINNATTEAVDAQLIAMMKYGDSAKAYAQSLAQ